MRILLYVTALVCMAMVSGCASHDKPEPRHYGEGPVPEIFRDPSNDQFMRAIAEYVQSKGGPANTRFEFTRVDLNGDGRREGIVMMKAPHQYWCGFNGCSMAIFKADNDYFELLSEVAPVRGPLVVSGRKTNGWSDILVRVSGRMNADAKDVALRFDGSSYPGQPQIQPQAQYAFNNYGGVRIFP